jgi:hypothetical protein
MIAQNNSSGKNIM